MPRVRPERWEDLWEGEVNVPRSVEWRPFLKGATSVSSVAYTARPSTGLTFSGNQILGTVAQILITATQPGHFKIYAKATLASGATRKLEILLTVNEDPTE